MMAKKREERYQTADEVVADLTAWLGEHGSDEWQQAHPGLSGNGRKQSDSSQKLADGNTEVPPIAKPVVPMAKAVEVKEPPASLAPSVERTEPAPLRMPVSAKDAGGELSAFLANLGTADSGAGSPKTEESHPPSPADPQQPSRKPPKSGTKQVAEAKPVQPAKPASGKSIQATPVAKPVQSAKPSQATPVAVGKSSNNPPLAKPAVPVAAAVPESSAQTAVADEPLFSAPDNEFVIDTTPESTVPTLVSTKSARTQSSKKSAENLKKLLKNKRMLAGAGGALLVLLLGMGAYWMFGGAGKSDNGNRQANGNIPEDASLIGKPILVGKDGTFPSLSQALAYVKKHYDPVEAEAPQEIRLAAGEVFAERIGLENRYADQIAVSRKEFASRPMPPIPPR